MRMFASVISRLFFYIFYYYWGKENLSLYRGLRYLVRLIDELRGCSMFVIGCLLSYCIDKYCLD